MLNTRLFQGKEEPLQIYNEQAVINQTFYFYEQECLNDSRIDYDFPGFSVAFFRVFNERLGRLIKDLQLTQNGAYLYLNASVSDMTFDDTGNYYYEIGFISNSYEQVLRYGKLSVI